MGGERGSQLTIFNNGRKFFQNPFVVVIIRIKKLGFRNQFIFLQNA